MLDLKQTIRVLPIYVINPRLDKEEAIYIGEELESLIYTLGGQIVDRVIQKLDGYDDATYIGKGKVIEVAQIVKEKHIDVVVLNGMAKQRQLHALEKVFEISNPHIELWDRVNLILHIFDKHASTTEAKLQIELARMRYMGTRIYGMGHVLSRQGGGIGTSGIGETNTELMKRHWRNEMKKITDQLEKISLQRAAQLERRKRSGFKTVSIIGYTNAGKTSLFNLLSGKHNLVENELFTTLDSSVGKLYIPKLQEEVLLTDTIGFIRNLPPRLIKAFKSTLMESMRANLLLHVIDVSDPQLHAKIQVVNEVLSELGRSTDDVIYIFNKIDAALGIDKEQLLQTYGKYSPIFISAKTREGTASIIETITRPLSFT